MIGTNDLADGITVASDQRLETFARSAAGTRASLSRRDFFDEVVAVLRESVRVEHAAFRHRANPMLLKIDFGNERVHYEVWPDSMRNQVEIGLHFEDGPVSTAAYLTYFDARIVEIKHQLGVGIELERWTLSWGHLFEIVALTRLDRPFARFVADRLAAQIGLLQPLIEDAAVPPEQRYSSSSKRERWPRHRAT